MSDERELVETLTDLAQNWSEYEERDARERLNGIAISFQCLLAAPEPTPEISTEAVERGAKALLERITGSIGSTWDQQLPKTQDLFRAYARLTLEAALTGGAA